MSLNNHEAAVRISVVVPNYNHAHFLPRCLEALLDQPVPPSEILVLDDGSKDNSRDVLRSYVQKSPLIHVHYNERNLGVCETMNRGLALAQGDYVAFPAADDQVKPGLFRHASEMLSAYPQAGVCSGICEWRSEASGLSWYVGAGMPKQAGYIRPQDMINFGRQGKLVIAGQNAVYKKSALIEAGGWIPELRWFTDWFGAYVVGFRYGMCHVPEVLSVLNIQPNSYYHSAKGLAERRQVLQSILRLLLTEKYADVEPLIRRSGIWGAFGWPGLQVVLGRPGNWRFFNNALALNAGRRCAEVLGSRYFPTWLARLCLKVFYSKG